jgi:hypothetical protein
MRKALFLSMFALCAAPAMAADTAQCDATAFTLSKSAPAAPKTAKQQPVVKEAAAQPTPKKAKPKPKTSSRLISDCKDDKAKKPG